MLTCVFGFIECCFNKSFFSKVKLKIKARGGNIKTI